MAEAQKSEVEKSPVRAVIDDLDKLTDEKEVRLGRLLDAFGATSFVPALMVPAILVVSPLSGIPGFSSICGLTIALIAVQMILSRDHLWLPGFLTNRSVKGERLHDAMQKLGRLADIMDRVSRDRLRLLTRTPGNRLPYLMCLIAGLMMPVLELVPFSSSILGLCTLSCAVGLITRDGLFVLLGGVFMAVAAVVPFFVVQQIAAL